MTRLVLWATGLQLSYFKARKGPRAPRREASASSRVCPSPPPCGEASLGRTTDSLDRVFASTANRRGSRQPRGGVGRGHGLLLETKTAKRRPLSGTTAAVEKWWGWAVWRKSASGRGIDRLRLTTSCSVWA